jgi:hypothetical protein
LLEDDLERASRSAFSGFFPNRVPMVSSRCSTPATMKIAVGVVSPEKPNRNGDAIRTAARTQSIAKCTAFGIWLFSDRLQSVEAAMPIINTPMMIETAVAAPLS